MSPTAPTTTAPVRVRLLEAAARITAEQGWSSVTMSKVAVQAGVSRQTVYNELGSKAKLGQAMVLAELERFLAAVATELDAHDDLVDAIRAAARRTLEMAGENPLLRAVLASAHAEGPGGSNDLLPFLTTDAEPLILAARTVIEEHIADRRTAIGLSDQHLGDAIDAIVRLVLSHVMQPGGSPEATAEAVAWIASRVLTPR